MQDEPGEDGMLRIDHQRARSREVKFGSDSGFLGSQPRGPVRGRNTRASLQLGGRGFGSSAVPAARAEGARPGAAVRGENDGPESGAGGTTHSAAAEKR